MLLLLLLYGGSISLAILPMIGGSVILFQIFQLITAAVPFLLALLLLCYVIIKADEDDDSSLVAQMGFFTVMYLTSIAASVLITLRYTAHELEKDYIKVHDSPLLTLLIVIISWVSAAIAFVGFLFAVLEFFIKRRTRDDIQSLRSDPSKPIRRHPKVRPGSLPIQTPPPTERRSFMHPPVTTYTRSHPYGNY